MAIDYSALKTELNTDPKSLGYAALLALPDLQGVADLLNAGSDGLHPGPAAETLPLDRVNACDAYAFLVRSELEALSTADQEYINNMASTGVLVFHHDKAKSAQNPNGTTQLLGELMSIFPDTTASGQTLRALINRPCSRAETLFGSGTFVTHLDVGEALRS